MYLVQEYVARTEEMPEPAVSAAEPKQQSVSDFTVMVPLANPRTSGHLLELGAIVAKANDGVVEAVHVVQVPDQTPLYAGAEQIDRIDAESKKLLAQARDEAETLGVDVRTRTIISHRSIQEVFDAADSLEADRVVMGWTDQPFWTTGRVESTFGELTKDLPCDFYVFKNGSFDTEHVLVPTAGGDDSALSAELARYLRDQRDATIELMYVVDDESERAAGASFLEDWAQEQDLGDAELTIDTSGDVDAAIGRHSRDATLVIVGATERGLLYRLVGGSLVYGIINEVECPVILSEKARSRSLWERLLGRRVSSSSEE